MATTTTELWRVVEDRGIVGMLDEYPIFSEAHRDILNKKILDHYADHEIGMESVPRFQLAMRRRMNEIMPYYNALYETQLLKIDPLNTMSVESVSENESKQTAVNDGVSSNTSESGAAGQVVNSDFPQTQLQRMKDYASSGTNSTNKAESVASGKERSTADSTNNDKSSSSTKGWQGSQAMLLMQFRATILNIDLEIVNQLVDLFLFTWNTGDNYTDNNRNGYPFL